MTRYDKPVLNTRQHIAQWEERGLTIPDKTKAEHYLNTISYYRLSAYTLPFQHGNPDHRFRDNVSFDDVLDLYIFDRELRLLVLDPIERIEVALRACMTNVLAEHHGTHAYLNRDIFNTRYRHDWLIERLEQKCNESGSETFIKHYINSYDDPPLPPIWMVMEILTFKEVSLLFSNLRFREDKQKIAQYWNMPDTVLKSWFRALSDLRNTCAHHSRTWNKEFGSRPLIPRQTPSYWADLSLELSNPDIIMTRRLYYLLVVIQKLLITINPGSSWHERLFALMQKHPNVSKAHMGMPENWHQDPFWRLKECNGKISDKFKI